MSTQECFFRVIIADNDTSQVQDPFYPFLTWMFEREDYIQKDYSSIHINVKVFLTHGTPCKSIQGESILESHDGDIVPLNPQYQFWTITGKEKKDCGFFNVHGNKHEYKRSIVINIGHGKCPRPELEAKQE
jgi:hypothetical protein